MSKNSDIKLDFKFILMTFALIAVCWAPLMRGLYFDADLLSFQLFSVIFFVVLLADIAVKRQIDYKLIGLDYSVILLFLAYFISFQTAIYKRGALRETLIYFNYLLIYFITWYSIQRTKDISRFINFLYISVIITVGVGLASATGLFYFPGAFEKGYISSTLQYKNSFGIFVVMGFFLSLGMWMGAKNKFTKSFHALIIYLFTLSLLGSQSRASWSIFLPLFVIMFYLLKDKIIELFYANILFAGTGLIVSRGFFPAAVNKDYHKALVILAIGAGVVILLQFLYEKALRLLRKVSPQVQRIFAVLGVLYICLLLVFYISHIKGAVPSVAEKFTSIDVVNKAATIGADDSSFEARKAFIADGVRIGRDFLPFGTGGGGWNALYHRYQTYLYWSTEPHSHPVKIWIEAGVIGVLAYFAMWIMGIYTSFQAVKSYRDNPIQNKLVLLTIGMVAIFMHSMFDFDLSLPGLLFYIAFSFGILRGAYTTARRRRQEVSYKYLLPAILIASSVIFSFYHVTQQLYTAGKYGADGSKAMVDKNYLQAAVNYKEAHRLDKYNHGFALDLAQVYTVMGLQRGEPTTLAAAKKYANEALALNPFDVPMQGGLIRVYILQKDFQSAIQVAENFVDVSPLNTDAYEHLAQAYFASLQNAVEKGDTKTSNDMVAKISALYKQQPTPFIKLTYTKALEAKK